MCINNRFTDLPPPYQMRNRYSNTAFVLPSHTSTFIVKIVAIVVVTIALSGGAGIQATNRLLRVFVLCPTASSRPTADKTFDVAVSDRNVALCLMVRHHVGRRARRCCKTSSHRCHRDATCACVCWRGWGVVCLRVCNSCQVTKLWFTICISLCLCERP